MAGASRTPPLPDRTGRRPSLSGRIAAGGYYLVKQADGAGGSVDLPTPDATGSSAMAGSNGKVALVWSAAALSGSCHLAAAALADFVGYGRSASCVETAPAPTLSNTSAALRKGAGSIDTVNNRADFDTGAPLPRNRAAAPPPLPEAPLGRTIAQIQGAGLRSPDDTRLVVTEGIVTAAKNNNGFFLKSANNDGNAATSEGIFVFTRTAPPASVAVGNLVRVKARVEEFVPCSTPNQLTIIELSSPTIEVLASGVTLPPAVELTANELGSDSVPGTLERYEGMRVSVAHSVMVAPAGGFIRDSDASATIDGIFHVVLPAIARPFREPGIGVLDAALGLLPAGNNPPLFDTNPERLMVRSAGQVGAAPVSLDADAQVAGLIGALDYFAGTWALLPDAGSLPSVSGGRLPEAVIDVPYDAVTIGSFNVLRLFDDVASNREGISLRGRSGYLVVAGSSQCVDLAAIAM